MNKLLMLAIVGMILTQSSLVPVESRSIPPFLFKMDEKYVRGERVDFIVTKGTLETFPFRVESTINIPITVEFDSTIQVGIDTSSLLPNGVMSTFDPPKITLQPGEIAEVNLVISIDDTADTNVYNNLYLIGIWKEEGKITESTSTSIRLHIGKDFGVIGSTTNTISPPYKQYKEGMSISEIYCKPDFVLVVKKLNGFPACVKSETKIKLIERGWAI